MTTDTEMEFVPPANPGDKLRRVLIIQFGPMRCFLEGMAASAYIRRTHRSAHITLLTEPRFHEFGKACPYFNDVEVLTENTKAFVLKKLKSAKYEMLYDFQNDKESLSIGKSLGIKLQSSIANGVSHTYRAFAPIEHYTRRVADQLFCAGIAATDGGLIKRWTEAERPRSDFSWIRAAFRNSPRLEPAFFNLYEKYALIIPGGPLDGTEASWSPQKFGQLANKIAEAGLIPVIVGNPTQGQAAQKINAICEKAVNLISRADFFQIISIAQRAQFFVGGETGPTYLAASTNIPGIVLFRQGWSQEDEASLKTIWNPRTRLGELAPKGGNIIANTAENIDTIETENVWQSILGLNVL